MLTIRAPAKLNLTLEVVGRRTDGYHEVRSLVQAIDLCDVLSFEPAAGISLRCSDAALSGPDNLVLRAAHLLSDRVAARRGAAISLTKNIPSAAGLGGGSSDAAATLLGVDRLWGLRLPLAELAGLAAHLGSDVPFFLYNGVAMAQGRGEQITPLSHNVDAWCTLVFPAVPTPDQKTTALYHALSQEQFTQGEHTHRAVRLLAQGIMPSPDMLFNVFEPAARMSFPGLASFWREAEHACGRRLHLAGSGPTLYLLSPREADAREISRAFVGRGWTSTAARTLPASPRVQER